MEHNYHNLNTILAKRAKDKETGVSLVEILVYIALFAVVAVMTVSIITTTMNSSARFSDASTTQTQVNQAASVIQRDIALATSVEKANSTSLTFITRQDNRDFRVSLFAYIPGTTTVFPANVDQSKLPAYSAIIQVRTDIANGQRSQTVLVKGYTAEVTTSGYDKLFTYYNAANSAINVTESSTQAEIDKIARVEFHIAAKADGRAGYVQIESSVTPSYKLAPNVSVADLVKTVPDCPANFNASIVQRETQATVTWNAPAGATSYTVYRYDEDQAGALEVSQIIPNPDTTSWVDTGLEWGHDYRYAIQASGPAGTTAACATDYITVVPNTTGFANINEFQQSLTAVKSGSGAETLTWNKPVGADETQSTQNVQAGNRYTVARNTTNQLAWASPFGATQYRIYINGSATPAATVSSGTLYWQDINKSFGAVTSYRVSSVNAGGESFLSSPITLTSPPAASTFTYARPDTSTRSTTTDNDISVVTRAPNTDGFKTERTITVQASGNCNLVAPLTASYFTGSSVRDSDVDWGSWSCYRFIPFNAAGDGAPSANMVIEQFPGKFNMTSVTSTQHRNININVPLPSSAQCWVGSNGATRVTCDPYSGMSSSNRMALGLFGSLDNTKTDINVVWQRSYNAYGDYTILKDRVATGGTTDQGSDQSTNRAGYVNGTQSSLFRNEMPGSAFDFEVTARALNGETRVSSNTVRALTTPDIPASMDNVFQTKAGNPSMRNRTYVDATVRRGMVDQIGIVSTNNNDRIEERHTADSATRTTYSTGYHGGWHSEYAYSYLSWGGMERYSQSTGRDGNTTPGCASPCGSSYGDIPEAYPRYYAGAHYRYNSGGFASSSVDGGPGNNNPAPNPTGPIPPPATGDADGGTSYNCSTISEDDPNFISEYGCNYGEGVPPAPTNLTFTRSNQDVTLNWSAVANATGYTVVYVTEGVSATKNVTGTTTGLTLPWDTTTTVTVRAKNAATESPDSNQVTIALPQAPVNPVTDLRLASLSGTSATLGWSAEPNVDTYDVAITLDGVTNTYNVNTTNYTYSIGYGSNSTAVVYAVKGTSRSPASNQVTVNNPVPAPSAAPASLTGDNSGGTTAVTPSTLRWSAVTCVTGTTPQYQLTRTSPTNAVVYAFGPATAKAETHTPGTSYTYSVVARCANGTKYSTQTGAATTTFTASHNAPTAPASAPNITSSAYWNAGSTADVTFPSNTCYAGTTPTYFLYRNGVEVGSSTTSTMTTVLPAAGTYSYTYTIACTLNGVLGPQSAASPVRSVTVTNTAAPTVTSSSIPHARVGAAYSYTVTATGTPAPTFSATGLPAGLTINSTTGVISGTPTTAATNSVTITVNNGVGTSNRSYTVYSGSSPVISTTALPDGRVGTAFSYDFNASGSPAPTFTATGLPAGLSIDSASGLVSGTPTASGTFNVTVTAANTFGNNVYSRTISVNETPTITNASLPAGRTGVAYSATITVDGYPTPFTYSATGLPAGLTLNTSTGVISGTPTTAANYTVTVTANNPTAGSGSRTYTVVVTAPPAFTTTATTKTGWTGAAYTMDFNASGNAITYTATGLPSTLTISSGSGIISGTPTVDNSYNITVTATNASGSVSKTFNVNIDAYSQRAFSSYTYGWIKDAQISGMWENSANKSGLHANNNNTGIWDADADGDSLKLNTQGYHPDGTRANGTITKQLTGLTSGRTYTVTGKFLRTTTYIDYMRAYTVSGSTTTIGTLWDTQAELGAEDTFRTFTYTFVASGTTASIKFDARNNDDVPHEWIIDQLTVR